MTSISSDSRADRLQNLLAAHADRLENAPAQSVLTWAHETFGPTLCATSSMADAVMVHLLAQCAPGTDVLFLDTGVHFPETLAFRSLMAQRYDVRVVDVAWSSSGARRSELQGEWARDPEACCRRRKVDPLNRALAPYDAWVTGIRRAESASRRHTRVLDWDERNQVMKIAPLAHWSDDEIRKYVREHALPSHALSESGYTSIGCAPCTARPTNDDPRSGRWPGWEKTECGLHQAPAFPAGVVTSR
ncbi:phosphoadenylyl-sulfate reductase [Nocardioides pocheonensis]|uniref:Adenosine 5'-phosphosulfate reductase n=1 Tax=Nocardioides pocheonensis TaxID=661485 RepID=A0A3N0GJ19_9ACTN|nr:phosphoadenylyl-sulfate reductase [Nocardioides pocheonensis]RNM12206.1 phosphoadenylyl-sulfate reductase [Nocardioides pocheonensis]